MLENDPQKRITAEECLAHSYFQGMDVESSEEDEINEEYLSSVSDSFIMEKMRKISQE
jgi:hypothetical protein